MKPNYTWKLYELEKNNHGREMPYEKYSTTYLDFEFIKFCRERERKFYRENEIIQYFLCTCRTTRRLQMRVLYNESHARSF